MFSAKHASQKKSGNKLPHSKVRQGLTKREYKLTNKIIFDCLGILPYCILVSFLVTIAGRHVSRFMHACEIRGKIIVFCMLLGIYFVPAIAVGCCWSKVSYDLLRHPPLNNIFYSLLISMKLLPVSVMVLYFVPQTISEQGKFCMELTGEYSKSSFSRILFAIRNTGRGFNASLLVVFLLAFSEFDIASFLSVKHWTVSLFDLNAGGLPVIESVKLCIFPVFIELTLILVFLFFYRNEKWLKKNEASELDLKKRPVENYFSWIISFTGLIMLMMLPLLALLRNGTGGFSLVLDGNWFIKETMTGIIFALTSSLLAFYVSGIVFHRFAHGGMTLQKIFAISTLMLPGLMGTLPIALVMLFLFQMPGLVLLRDTPLPLLAAMTLFQLPYALFLRYAFSSIVQEESVFIAESALHSEVSRKGAAEILWRLKYAVKFCIFFIIFIPTYFDISISAVLSPPTMPTVFPRLYNLLHYGQNEKLSATILLSVIMPVAIFLILIACSRIIVPILATEEKNC